MWLNASPTRPTSLTGSVSPGGTRTGTSTSPRSSSSADTAEAVAVRRFNGASERTTTARAAKNAIPIVSAARSASSRLNAVMPRYSWVMGRPMIVEPPVKLGFSVTR